MQTGNDLGTRTPRHFPDDGKKPFLRADIAQFTDNNVNFLFA